MSSRDELFERIFNQSPKGPVYKAEKLSDEEREHIKRHKLRTIIGNAPLDKENVPFIPMSQ